MKKHLLTNRKSRLWIAWIAPLLALAGGTMARAAAPALVYADFDNILKVGNNNPAATASSSAAMFTGSAGAYTPPGSGIAPAVPGGGSIRLVESSFGQTFSANIPFVGFEFEAIVAAQRILYPSPDLKDPVSIANSTAAFRYRDVQYAGTTDGKVRLNYESVASLFGDAERAKIQAALVPLRDALKYAPSHQGLRRTLLDVYYDWAIAEQQLAKEAHSKTTQYRLGIIPLGPNEFIIDKEIENSKKVLERYDAIWAAYSGLFNDRMGVNLADFYPSAPANLSLGSFIFREEQPTRDQFAASYWEGGIHKSFTTDGAVTDGAPALLFPGYKDYVALLKLMRDYMNTGAEAARLYALRRHVAGGASDLDAAVALMQRLQTETFVNLTCLEGLLPNARAQASQQSGLVAAWEGVRSAMVEMEGVAAFLRGDKNALGFDPDMLVLLPSPAGTPDVLDSYDAIMKWIEPDLTGFTVLGFARNRFDEAEEAYKTYREYADQLAGEVQQVNLAYADRYREITGYLPEDAPDPWPSPRPAFPVVDPRSAPTHVTNPRPGSELYNSYLTISQSDTQKATLQQLDPLLQSQMSDVNFALWQANQYNDQVYQAAEDYQLSIRINDSLITAWNVEQAAAQVEYDMFTDAFSMLAGGGVDDFYIVPAIGAAATLALGAVNMMVQTTGEAWKGYYQQELDVAAVTFQKELATAGVNQGALAAANELRSLQREQISHTVELNDVAFQRQNEQGRVAGLKRELAQIATRRAEHDKALAGRYFADPVHFLRTQSTLVEADFAFREAQRWVFHALRALEYKYEQPFAWDSGTRTWDTSSLFALRSFQELERLLAAMQAFDAHWSPDLVGRSSFTDHISLREDVWKIGADPASTAKFRARLADTLNTARGVYEIAINTLTLSRDLNLRADQGAFFVGPEYDALGQVLSAGRYLDKIESIKFKFLSPGLPSPQSRDANFSYGGVAYARTRCSQALQPQTAEASGELLSFPFRYYRPSAGGGWTPNLTQEANVSVTFSKDPGEPPLGANTVWRERSVAASRWTLELAQSRLDPNTVDDLVIYVRHNAALRQKNCQ